MTDSPQQPVHPPVTPPTSAAPPQKSFLTQRFAKIAFGQYSVVGYSVAGEETVVQVPELNICFDIGRAPHFALTSDIVCISHGHMDHLAGLAYYLSQRNFQGMKGGTVLVPQELYRGVDNLLKCWRDVERQGTPYTLVPMVAGQTYEVRRDFVIRALGTHHGGGSLGYSLVSVREKLKPEYMNVPGPELAAMRKRGVEIQYKLEVPLVTYLGDTTIGSVFEQPDVVNAEILITEITFFDKEHMQRAKVGKHLHVNHFAELVGRLNNKYVVVAHVSRRTGIRRAKKVLERIIGRERMGNIHFLMDFDQAKDAGAVEDQGPLPPDTAE